MNKKTNWNGGIFFYIFYLAFFAICASFSWNVIGYCMGKEVDVAIVGKLVSVIISYFCVFSVFKKRRKKLITLIVGVDEEGIKNALASKARRRSVEKALDTCIKFGVKKGIKKLKRILEKVENYDDRAFICYLIGLFYERADRKKEALENYHDALRYRPYYVLAEKK